MAVARGMQKFLKMWDWEKAIPRKMYIHMSAMGYRDEQDIFYLSF